MKTYIKPILLAAAWFAAATAGGAQTAARETLTLEGAKRVLAAAEEFARRNGAGGAIAVVDAGGHLLAVARLDGTFAAAAEVAAGKARTAALFQKPTSAFEKLINEGRTAMAALPDFTPLQGGIPITVGGAVVGAVGVSGAKSAQQDEEMALYAAQAVEPREPGAAGAAASAAPAAVTHIDQQGVDAAFRQGAPLLENETFKVHASRRDRPGQAEIHRQDTDIIYVVEGSAVLVTGGSVVEPKEVAPDEIRGAALVNGEARSLAKGDVIVVPAGTPHWFREVPGPFRYYVVKAH